MSINSIGAASEAMVAALASPRPGNGTAEMASGALGAAEAAVAISLSRIASGVVSATSVDTYA